MKRRSTIAVVALGSVLVSSPLAAFESWTISEIYSSIDGTVQFIELFTTSDDQEFTAGHIIRSSQDLSTKDFVFPTNTPSPTGGHYLLLATAAFTDLSGSVTPDFIIEDGFLSWFGCSNIFGGVVEFLGANTLTYYCIPGDGISSLHCDVNDGTFCADRSVRTNSPTNYKGQIGSIDTSGTDCLDPNGDDLAGKTTVSESSSWIIPPLAVGSYQRSLALIFPPCSGGVETAFRVKLVTLYDPADPQPMDQPDYSGSENEFRYLNLYRDGSGNPVTECVSSSAWGFTYPCASVGCEPEFVDWGSLFGGVTMYVSGNAIIPDSEYTVAHLSPSCMGNEEACVFTSGEIPFSTPRYGDTEPNNQVNVTDIVNTVDVVKQTITGLREFQVYIRNPIPSPQTEATSVTDIVLHVDALKLISYVLPVNPCP